MCSKPPCTVSVAEVRTTVGRRRRRACEQLGDVDGRGLELGAGLLAPRRAGEAFADAAGGAALDPEDGVGVVGFEQELEVGADVGDALAQAGVSSTFLMRSSSASRRLRALRTER
jgi:hypothetical protein